MLFVVGIVMLVFLSSTVWAKDMVTVYTSLETDEVTKYLEVARKDLPDLEINIIRLSTGELGARMLDLIGLRDWRKLYPPPIKRWAATTGGAGSSPSS